jgi:hypothetical protein
MSANSYLKDWKDQNRTAEKKFSAVFGGITKSNIRGILLKRCETKRWRKEFVYSKWLGMNENASYMKVFTRKKCNGN